MKKFITYLKTIKISKVTFVVVGLLALLSAVVIAANDNEVNACVNNKTGSVRIINFLGGQCSKSEASLAWNKQGIQGIQGIEGVQGPKGDKGDVGLPAQHGVGDVAFINEIDEVVKTDGTFWLYSNSWIPNPNVPPVPIPISNIVDITAHNILDSNGNVWRLNNGSWNNVGHP